MGVEEEPDEEEEELPGLRLCDDRRGTPGAFDCGEGSEGRGRETCLEHLCRAQLGPGWEGEEETGGGKSVEGRQLLVVSSNH